LWVLETGRAEPAGPAWHPKESEEVWRVYRLTSVYCVVICKYVNQDEDEVNLLIRISN
jgi:hypothetical protein